MPENAPSKEMPAVNVRSLSCPNCGAALTVRSFGQAVNVVCGHCQSILDAQDATLKILQQFHAAIKHQPLIPLGTRGKIRGIPYELTGFQRREIEADGISYSWGEYVLFNPTRGFRYLTEFDGHWNDVSPLRSLPENPGGPGTAVTYLGETYRHFQSAQAKTSFVIGEFPWQVRVGEAVEVADYVSPPRVLSAETTADREVTWSLGEYMTGADIWKAFALPGSAPPATGVYENQPSPFASTPRMIWTYCGMFLIAAMVLMIGRGLLAKDTRVFSNSYVFDPRAPGERSFVTSGFELAGRPAPVEVETITALDNSWIDLDYSLINQDTGQAYDFGRAISYYHGSDADGSWSEGSQHDSVTVGSVPPGHYYLRIEPEGDRGSPISYTVTVTHDVPVYRWFPVAAGLLVVPALFVTWRSMNFEHLRWQESDHAGFQR
jgi:Domain of unknown function (DUF4178)